MSLTKKQTAKAARLYALAVIARVNAAAADDEDGHAVVTAARLSAQESLDRLGHEASDLLTLEDCIRAARAA